MKKIATLEVYEVEKSDSKDQHEVSSFYQQHDEDETLHRIVLNPIHRCDVCGDFNKVNVLAHELGHFVSRLTDSPTSLADKNRHMFELVLGIDTRIPEEKYAWEIAEKMGLPIDPERKAKALKSYTG